jgi:hypothetical protein
MQVFKKILLLVGIALVACPLFAEGEKGLAVVEKTRVLKDADEYKAGKRWALVIGVNNYEDEYIADLEKARNDAKVMADLLAHEGQFDEVFLYTDDAMPEDPDYATLANVEKRLESLKSEIKPEDTVMVTFSGHGITDDKNRSYLLLADSKINEPFETSLSLQEIQDWIEGMGVQKNIVLLDACRNQVEKSKSVNTRTLVDEKNAQAKVSAVVYSTSPGEFSYEHHKEPYGVFTTYMIRGLQGEADSDGDVLISFNELRTFIEAGVGYWATEKGKKQKPFTSIKGEFHGDLVLSVTPFKARPKYNPTSFKNSYITRLNFHYGMKYATMGTMILGFTGAAVGGILFGVGAWQYQQLTAANTRSDWDLWRGMMDGGFYSMIAFASLGVSFTIPFGISFALNPKRGTNKQIKNITLESLDINIGRDGLGVGMRVRI